MKKQFSEAIRFRGGVFHRLEYHQRRVDRTVREFGGRRVDLAEILCGIETPVSPETFKCRVVYGETPESVKFIRYVRRRVAAVAVIHADDMEYGYKYADRSALDDLLRSSGCDDMIIVRDGFVTDGFSSNLVFESEEGLFTPKTFLLPGTKRQFLIDTGIISERTITGGDIARYAKVRFVNAMTDLEDGVAVDTNRLQYL